MKESRNPRDEYLSVKPEKVKAKGSKRRGLLCSPLPPPLLFRLCSSGHPFLLLLSLEDNASAFDPSALVDALQDLQSSVASQGAGLAALTRCLDDAG